MMHKPSFCHAGYMRYSLQPTDVADAIRLARPVLSPYEFEAFAFRGMSGTLLAGPFAQAFNKTLILVRKTTSDCHSKLLVEGDHAARRYIIIDEFISVGRTAHAIRKEVFLAMPEAQCVGVLEVASLFCHSYDITPGFDREYGKLTQFVQKAVQLGQGS